MKKILSYLLFAVFLTIISSPFNYSQYQEFEKFDPVSKNIIFTTNSNDPNLIYWDELVKFSGLEIAPVEQTTLPFELAWDTQVQPERTECINQWNTYGCIQLKDSYIGGVNIAFSNDDNIFRNSTEFGATLLAVQQSSSGKYEFSIYPSQSLSNWPFTAIYLNKTADFYSSGFQWTTERVNIGIDYIPFKALLLHELGHILGLGHNYYENYNTVMLGTTPLNNFVFNLTDVDKDGISTICSLNGTPTGVEDYIWIENNLEIWNVGASCQSCASAHFVDVFPYGDYITSWGEWEIKALHSCGDIIIYQGLYGGLITIPELPSGYNWNRDETGNVLANLTISGTDNQGIVHRASTPMKIGNVPNTFITSGTLPQDTYWCGEVNLTGSITVPVGKTLYIEPGTIVKFPQNSSLIVQGKLDARMCKFTSQSGTTNSSWGSIILDGSGAAGSTIKYATIKYATEIKANNTSGITIQYCNVDTTYNGIHFYNSSGSILNNTVATNSAGHGIIVAGGSSATVNDNIVTKTSTYRSGVGIYFGGGAWGSVAKNDIYGWDWGICAIWGSSPISYSSESMQRNNRVRNCNTGFMVYRLSYADFGYPAVAEHYSLNSLSNNTYNARVGTSYPEYESRLYAHSNWWGSNPPNTSLFQVGYSSQFYYDPPLSLDPWGGIPKISISSNNETNLNKVNQIPDNDINSLIEGIELRLQGKLLDAKNFFISYLANYPENQQAYVEFYNCYSKETSDEIIKFFSSLPEKADKDHKLLLSYLHLKNGDYKKALEVNNSLISGFPNSSLAARAKLNNAYIALYNENNINEAITYFNEVVRAKEVLTPVELSIAHNDIEFYGKTYNLPTSTLAEFQMYPFSEEELEKEENKESVGLPDKYELIGNYPNPFNPNTIIKYSLKENGQVILNVYDILGSKVTTLVNKTQQKGTHSVEFNATYLPSGVYVYTLQVNGYFASKKMLLLK